MYKENEKEYQINTLTLKRVPRNGELHVPRRNVFVKLVVQHLIQAKLGPVFLERSVDIPGGGRGIPAYRHVLVQHVHRVVLDRRIQDLQRPPLQAIERVPLRRAFVEQSRVLVPALRLVE